ncbi:TRAP transporter permease [Geomicrobium sp. JSM 1781026]|uniref:TRAP transporter permease n=1 Tax=Geomicrobium sp. JSM 1781026 TaxID=3344580 RepID=UPI0035BFA980
MLSWLIRWFAILFALFHLYEAFFSSVGTFELRVIHFAGAAFLIYLIVLQKSIRAISRVMAVVLAFVSLLLGVYLLIEMTELHWRLSVPLTSDIILGFITLLIIFDITRRTIGWALPIITVAIILYGVLGSYIPGYFGHAGYSIERIAVYNFLSTAGMFGTPIGIMAQLIFIFILFGVSLEVSGAGSYFLKLAKAIAGKLIGGPAKMAVVGSALFGSMSGSAVANTVATGSLTIPLMKRLGYKPHVAAGIEASASTGGQMVPPIMGAAAFLISEYTGTPFLIVAITSVLPVIAYYIAVYSFVHIEAKKQGISGLPKEEIPRFWKTFWEGAHFFLPIVLIVVMFTLGFSVALSAASGTLLLFLIMFIQTRFKVSPLLQALEDGTKSAVNISSATICAGVIVGLISLTGSGLKFSSTMMTFAGTSVFLAILLLAAASFILGMGLPVVAAYIVLVTVAGPSLGELGVPLLITHLMVFWFSQLSNVTPPVALAAYAGAGIAKADPFKTSLYAVRIAIPLPIIPLLFFYRPMLVGIDDVPWWEFGLTYSAVILGLIALVSGLHGYLNQRLTLSLQCLMLGLSVALLVPVYTINLVAGVLFLIIYFLQKKNERKIMNGGLVHET